MFDDIDSELVRYPGKCIDDLPEEVLEIILLKLSPYRDLKSASLVCSAWHKLVQVVLRKLRQTFVQSVATSKLEWSSIRPDPGCRITERYSHCCVYYDKSLYVFGGCTATNTTLNDLWRFDLAKREWIRPLATGTYPFPKACASMVVYKDSLVLFGGWSHPTPFPLHQAARFFSELHIYKPFTNRWSHVTTLSHQSPQPMAGHSASIVGNCMVVFGGSQVPGIRTNEVWVFDFDESAWHMPKIGYKRPAPRYGQTQVTVDDKHILIVGGCGGGSPNQVFSDCWLLTIGDEEWTWDPIRVTNTESAAPQMWCHSACKVDNMIVTLSKATKAPTRTVPVNPRSKPRSRLWVPPSESEIKLSIISSSQSTNTTHQPLTSRYESVSKQHLPTEAVHKVPIPSDHQNIGQAESVGPAANSDTSSSVAITSTSESKSCLSPNKTVDAESHQSEHNSVSHDDNEAQKSHKTSELHQNENHQPQATYQPEDEPEASTSSPRPGHPSIRPNAMKNREKQLEALLKYEKRLRQTEMVGPAGAEGGPPRLAQNLHNIRQRSQTPASIASTMAVHVLDISRVVNHGSASWLNVSFENVDGAPDETVFYTLVEGRGEILMFGGIEKDIHALQRGPGIKSQSVNNTLFVLSPVHQLL